MIIMRFKLRLYITSSRILKLKALRFSLFLLRPKHFRNLKLQVIQKLTFFNLNLSSKTYLATSEFIQRNCRKMTLQ